MMTDTSNTLAIPLSGNDSIPCPECGRVVPDSSRAAHLVIDHGYLSIAGNWMPRAAALACLWDRVFAQGDQVAHDRLCELLAGDSSIQNGRSPYAAGLENELRRRLGRSRLHHKDADRLLRHLRSSSRARPHFWDLLLAGDERIRRLGRELVWSQVGEELAARSLTRDEIRNWVERLTPAEDVWDKIRVCHRLAQFDIEPTLLKECLRQLEDERPVACPECGAGIPQIQLGRHLRQVHRIFEFQGNRRSQNDTLNVLLSAVCGTTLDYQAWETLEAMVKEARGAQAGSFLADRLGDVLETVPSRQLTDTLHSTAELISHSDLGPAIASQLARTPQRSGRLLAIVLIARLRPPLPGELVDAVLPLLARRHAPEEYQITAAAALLSTTGTDGPAANRVLDALLANCRRGRSVERLRQLDRQAGNVPLIVERCQRIEQRIRMRCPRCRIQLRRPAMTRHLWIVHSLLLDGRRVRKPWKLIEEWIADYQRSHNEDLLTRCRLLGPHLDPEHGLERVYRLFLAHGVEHFEARQILLAGARKRTGTLCPHCYALTPIPREEENPTLNQWRGRLSLAGYCVEVSTAGWTPQLLIETPRRLLYRGPEPGRWLTWKSAALFWAGLPVLAALAVAVFGGFWRVEPEKPVALAILLGSISYCSARIWWLTRPRELDRAVDFAWNRLIPMWQHHDFLGGGSPFLAGLAKVSVAHGRPEERRAALGRALTVLEEAHRTSHMPVHQLAAVRGLQIMDECAAGNDVVPLLAEQISRCFEAELPMAYAQRLLSDTADAWRPTGTAARLRICLCDRAFEAGLEIQQLAETGQMAPLLGQVLGTRTFNDLAPLRLLWTLRPLCPWERWSKPDPVFDLARDRALSDRLLGRYPDLLLVDRGVPAIFICSRGIVFQDVLFASALGRIEMVTRKDFERVQYELVMSGYRFLFPSEPTGVIHRLERWSRYFFGEFQQRTAQALSWEAPPGTTLPYATAPLRCPDCHRLILAAPGEIGTIFTRPGKD